jgi:hypothetical protein
VNPVREGAMPSAINAVIVPQSADKAVL